jgi:hypothetical protein
MSAAEFSAALRNKALQEWFKSEKAGGGSASKDKQDAYRLENINVLTNSMSTYRSSEQTSSKTAFVITKETVRDLIVQFHGVTDTQILSELSDQYFAAFKAQDVGAAVPRKKITVGEGLPAVYFPNISFDTITRLVNNVMNIKSGELQKHYEKGHVVGLTTELLQATASRISAVDTKGQTGKAFLLNQLDNIIAYYKRLDLASANLRPHTDIKLYASFEKRINKNGKASYLVELQPKKANQESAREVQGTIGSIRKLFNSGSLSEAAIKDLIDILQSKVTDPKFQQDLLEMRSSPSMVKMIETSVLGAITGKLVDQAYSAKNVSIGTKKIKNPNLTQVRAESKKKISKANAIKRKLETKGKKQTVEHKSLAALQMLLNAQLQNVISANMGDGNAKNVLNYRTGRLAESAKVERLSESRAGMITAFYSYMKYPYATFSEGGKQQHPRSRDPKLLIAKSIREIAATRAYMNLRSVNV